MKRTDKEILQIIDSGPIGKLIQTSVKNAPDLMRGVLNRQFGDLSSWLYDDTVDSPYLAEMVNPTCGCLVGSMILEAGVFKPKMSLDDLFEELGHIIGVDQDIINVAGYDVLNIKLHAESNERAVDLIKRYIKLQLDLLKATPFEPIVIKQGDKVYGR